MTEDDCEKIFNSLIAKGYTQHQAAEAVWKRLTGSDGKSVPSNSSDKDEVNESVKD